VIGCYNNQQRSTPAGTGVRPGTNSVPSLSENGEMNVMQI